MRHLASACICEVLKKLMRPIVAFKNVRCLKCPFLNLGPHYGCTQGEVGAA